jgi:hypothetical protein
MKRIALLGVLFLLFVPVAFADSGDFTTVTAYNVVIGPETISFSVNWNWSTKSFAPGTFQYISTNGPLGLFTFDGVGGNGSFNFVDASGDVLDVSNNNEPNQYITFPDPGLYNAGYAGIWCDSATCFQAMGGGYQYTGGGYGSIWVTDSAPVPTPEPGTLLLLTSGLCGLLCFPARKFPQVIKRKFRM